MWLFAVFVISIYLFITRGIPRILSWFIIIRYHIFIKIGRITLPYFRFEDVLIKKASLSIKIDEIRATSSLWNQDERKLFAIRVSDVRIEKENVISQSSYSRSYSNDSMDEGDIHQLFETATLHEEVEPLLRRIPPSIISLAQFFGLRILSLNMVYLRSKWPECLVHASAEEISLEGSTVSDVMVALNISVVGAHIRTLQQPEQKSSEKSLKLFGRTVSSISRQDSPLPDPSLMESTISLKVYVELKSDTWAEVETLSIHLSSPDVVLQERLFQFLDNKALVKTPLSQKHVLQNANRLTAKQLLRRYLLFLPRKLQIKCKSFSLRFANAVGKVAARGYLTSAEGEAHFSRESSIEAIPTLLPDLSTEVQLDKIHVMGVHDTDASISRVSLQTQFVGDRINVKMELNSLHGTYDYKDIELWVHYCALRRPGSQLLKKEFILENPESDSDSGFSVLPFCVGIIFEVWDISVGAIFPSCQEETPSGVSSAQFLLQHSKQSLVLTQGMNQVAGETIIESLVMNMSPSCLSSSSFPPKRSHAYGTAAFVGLCIMEVSSIAASKSRNGLFPLKFETLLDNIQLEWSDSVATFVGSLTRYVEGFRRSPSRVAAFPEKMEEMKKILAINAKCSSINVFCHTEHNVSAMVRVDDFQADKLESDLRIRLDGVKCIQFTGSGKNFQCVRSSELKDYFFNVTSLVLEGNGKEIHLNTNHDVGVMWSTGLHMMMLLLFRDIKEFFTAYFKPRGDVPYSDVRKIDLKLQVVAKGDIKIGAKLSNRHTVQFSAGDFVYLMANGLLSLKTDELKIAFDDNEVFLMKNLQLLRLLNSADLQKERSSFKELLLQQNKAWKVVIDRWKTTFPYEYNFAEAFTDDLVSIVKWIKLVHEFKPKEFSEDSPLPPDIIIQVKYAAVEVCDDPFEVKLRYNYELMEDEYVESCKRMKALEKRIEETRKTNLQLLSGKINELFKILQQKNGETYVKRSKKMYEKEPMRTQLFLWSIENVFLYAMADPSFHGTNKVVENLREIDRESPWPEEGLTFSTLWCRLISATCSSWKFVLRDYPQPMWDITNMEIYGWLIGAEETPTKRAKRSVTIDLGAPFQCDVIERSLNYLKFYHDFTWEADSFTMAYGPCWEPAMSQFNIALSLISHPSLDPSVPLPWWDKMRLLLHGRLTLLVDQMTLLLHASLDPYNTTEEMELTGSEMTVYWTNANIVLTGDLNVLVRTASKYDDVRLMNLPNLQMNVKLLWVCKGNPNEHHSVSPCAPDKVPEYSINQEHDSFRVFRSQSLKMNISLETRPSTGSSPAAPIEIIFYGSTLRWFENLKFIICGVTRPTRRGTLFQNTLAKKPQLSRHYQTVHISFSLQRFEIKYWLSARVKKGFIFTGERLSLSSEHSLTLASVNDRLRHRALTSWSIVYLNTELWEAQIWLISAVNPESPKKLRQGKDDKKGDKRDEKIEKEDAKNLDTESLENLVVVPQLEKFYFLNITKVAYMRETLRPPFSDQSDHTLRDTPTHRLVVHNLKGVWTTSNRDIMFSVYDSWSKAQELKRNLAPNVFKTFNIGNGTPQKQRTWSSGEVAALSPTTLLQVTAASQNTPSPRTRLQSDHTSAMLQQLIAEADNNYIAYAEDCSTPEPRDLTLQGIKAACTSDDVIHNKWLIQLVNSQVLLKGSEMHGYVIISAAQSQVSQRVHRPTWRDHSLVTKTTWSGSLECMQYYATVSEGNKENEMDNIMWLSLDNIEEKDGTVITEVTDIVGSGQSVGGVVSETVGISNAENEAVQLQRIISRCRCEFFYVSYGETGLDPTLLEEVQPPPLEEGLWNSKVTAADTFTLMHYDVCSCTNYLQYNMVVDILNNLLLYMDPAKKEASEALARMRFKLQLYSTEDQRKPIIRLQNQVRYHLSQLRYLEKEVYMIQRQMDKESTPELLTQINSLEAQASECKEKVNALGEELSMRIHCYNETQLSANNKLAASKEDKEKSVMRMNEVYFRKAQWKLTDEDGQLGIAQLDLSNFLYSKKTFSDDTTEHLLELGFINVCNLLPNQIYKDVLAPAELKSSMPVDRQKTLRVFCREKPPCGGISILEHFEINVVPLKIELTYQFFKTMLKFCFPYNNPDEDVESAIGSKSEKSSSSHKKAQKVSSFYIDLKKDDVEIMKQRAEQNKHFVFIKIPELPVNLSYKGKKEKNIEDVHSYNLVIPTMEYHSVTWTWLDLLLAVKMTSKSALLSQAIKHKLNITHLRADDASTPTEEDKARLLLGSKYMQQTESKGNRKALFKL